MLKKKMMRFMVSVLLVLVATAGADVTIYPTSGLVQLTGKYNVSDGNPWYVTWHGVNLSSLSSGAFNLAAGDNSSGSGWEKFFVQIHDEPVGGQGYLLQAYDRWFEGGPKSNHQFNLGVITGAIDVRFVLEQNPNDTWAITPQYYVPTGSTSNPSDGSIGGVDAWHSFYDGSYTSVLAFDLTVLQAGAQFDPTGTGGSVTV